MKIEDNRNKNTLRFKDLKTGDAFRLLNSFNEEIDCVFIKTETFGNDGENMPVNAVEAETGELKYICSDYEVVKLNAKIVIE